jgi:hypothetical protein
MKSGNLNFLEPSGPLQACNGTALPLYIFKRISGLAKNRYVTFSTSKMEAERPFHKTINFCRKHDFRTEKTVLLAVTILTHTKGLSILHSAIYKSFIETMKGEIRAWVKGIKQKINKVTKNQETARIMSF